MMEKRKAPLTQGQKHSKGNETNPVLLDESKYIRLNRPVRVGVIIERFYNRKSIEHYE